MYEQEKSAEALQTRREYQQAGPASDKSLALQNTQNMFCKRILSPM